MSAHQESLSRRLGLTDAVAVGMGAMVGAGVFAVLGPAAQAAGSGLLVALVVAAAVAYLNAVASAQLAAASPTSGGTYVFGRERLGPWWGFAAGWSFVIGKTASCAAMALVFAAYAVPGPEWVQRVAAAAVVVALAALNYRGVTKTVALTKVLLLLTLAALVVVVVALLSGDGGGVGAGVDRLGGWSALDDGGLLGTLQAAGLMFFAFAGYARLATLGEEVVDPRRTIPRAILVALGLTVAIYLVVAVAALLAAGPERLAGSATPLVEALDAVGQGVVAPVVGVGAAVAALGALLSLMAGIGRTTLAMGRNRDLPAWLAAVHPIHRSPHHAEIALAVVVAALVLTVDLRDAIGFSSFGVLLYYAIANLSALTQPADQRRWPRWFNVLGAAGCLVLVATLPGSAVAVGVIVLAVGLLGRAAVLRARAGAR
ncbi:APC family permease [Aeromicrobium sp. Sec7.5]|uniref:APC family permease n=1 Tax=Aeromicrobium sp. Sec7.5 TaxID=3121276 RepID=UPI002FE47F8F